MILPELPKKIKHQEADFGLLFRKYIHLFPIGSYELKNSRGKDYFYLSEITDKQRHNALLCNSEKGNLIRIIIGKKGLPDYIYLKNINTYLAIKYPKFFVVINFNKINFNKIKLTESEAKKIADYII